MGWREAPSPKPWPMETMTSNSGRASSLMGYGRYGSDARVRIGLERSRFSPEVLGEFLDDRLSLITDDGLAE